MSKVISAQVSDDLADEIETIREDGESRSDAVERIIRRGVAYIDDQTNTRDAVQLGANVFAFLWIASFLLVSAEAASLVGGVAIAAAAFWSSYPAVRDGLQTDSTPTE